MVGSGIACRDDWQVLWFDVGNFKIPWQDEEEVVLIIEATKGGSGYFAVLDLVLDQGDALQSVGEITLLPIPEPELYQGVVRWQGDDDNVIGYSLYRGDERINEKVLTERDYLEDVDVVVRPVIRGGYETVYASHGSQTALEEKIPSSYSLYIVPNLFTGTAKIFYHVVHRSEVAVRVYDVSGRLVRTLVNGTLHSPGYYHELWNGCDDAGRRVAAGIYFVEFDAGNYEKVEKIILLQ